MTDSKEKVIVTDNDKVNKEVHVKSEINEDIDTSKDKKAKSFS